MKITCKKARSHSGGRKVYILEFESQAECDGVFDLMSRTAECFDDNGDLVDVPHFIEELHSRVTDQYAHDDVALSVLLTSDEVAFLMGFMFEAMDGLDDYRYYYDRMVSITDDVFDCAGHAIGLAAECLEEQVECYIKYMTYRLSHEDEAHADELRRALMNLELYLADIREFRSELDEENAQDMEI